MQPLVKLSSTESSRAGKLRDVSAVQFRKTLLRRLRESAVSSSKVTDFREVQPSKAFAPIDVTEPGILMLSRFVQF